MAATYSRSNFFVGSSGNVLRGGYLLVLLGSPAHGSGPTLEEALSDLLVDVRAWIEGGAATALASAARSIDQQERLGQELRSAVREPVLDPSDEPRR